MASELLLSLDELQTLLTTLKVPPTLSPSSQALLLLGFWILLCYIVGFVSGNFSQVDKLWSITPWLYMWVYAFNSPNNERLGLMAIVSTIWGIRLTLNFNRRGGYTWPPWGGEEDYRWEHVRERFQQKTHPWRFEIFHFGFICVFQHVLLWWIAMPAQIVHAAGETQDLTAADAVLAGAILGMVALETLADHVQYEFQTEKYDLLNSGVSRKNLPAPFADGFIHSGVWALSRHPNYFAEQSIWVLFNGFSVLASGLHFNYAMLGCVVLIALFQGSIDLQESITAKKWPRYKDYQAQVPQLLPYGRGMEGDDDE